MIDPNILAKCGTEAGHQAALFCWCAQEAHFNKKLWMLGTPLIFAIQNEEHSNSVIIGTKRKATGCKAGVADIFLAYPCGGYAGLFLEMKIPQTDTKKCGVQSEKQKLFEVGVLKVGYLYELAFGWEHAKEILKKYLLSSV